MSKFNKRFTLSIMVVFVFFLTSVFFLPPGGGAQEAGTIAPSGEMDRFIKSVSGTIELKTDTAVVMMERSYTVTEETIIQDRRGEEITLSRLPTPCEAEVKYQLKMDQDPLCLKIVVKKLKRKARSINE